MTIGIEPGTDERFSPENRKSRSGPGLRTFMTLSDLWGLSEEQCIRILGSQPVAAYEKWTAAAQQQRDITLDTDVLMRISAVIGINVSLKTLYENVEEVRG